MSSLFTFLWDRTGEIEAKTAAPGRRQLALLPRNVFLFPSGGEVLRREFGQDRQDCEPPPSSDPLPIT